MVDASYNRMSSVAIGGTYVNNIPTIYGNVSLDVSGHAAIRGNLYVSGTANIDVSGGGFSGTDLSLNGNIYLGGALYSRSADSSFNIYANTITHKSGDGTVTYMNQYYDYSIDDIQWESHKNFTINTADGRYMNATSGGSMGYDASQNMSFISRNGQISFSAEQADIFFDASLGVDITSNNDDIYFNPRNGVNGKVILDGKLQLTNGIQCSEPSNILQILTTDFMDIYGALGSQMNFYKTGVTGNSTSIGYDSVLNIGYIGTGGTNVDFSIDAGRYIRLQKPLYVDYTYADISRSNWQIGWTQNTANPNTGNTYTGTAADSGTVPAQVGTFTLPSFGVWLIQFDCLFTLNTGSDTIQNKAIYLSDTTASATECAPGFIYEEPIDDAAGSAGSRQVFSFSGIYHYTSSTVAVKYINVLAQTSGTRTVTASGSYKYTRLA